MGRAAGGALRRAKGWEWPTLILIVTVHGGWIAVLAAAGTLGPLPAMALLVPILVLHASLQHEVTHGHPTGDARLDDALVFVPLGLAIPYGRFKALHLAHHHDPNLTDPYDDPETNYWDPAVWVRLPAAVRAVLRANNTLLGRVALGPALGLLLFWIQEARSIDRDERGVARAWLNHGICALPVVWAVSASALPWWAYGGAIYAATGILRIRTFLEHRAHALPRARTVVIEDRGPLAFLFLNNNFHALHHARPGLAWYVLPAAYVAERAAILRRNEGYLYRSYAEVARAHLLRPKDPVPHPYWAGADALPQAGRAEGAILGAAALARVEPAER